LPLGFILLEMQIYLFATTYFCKKLYMQIVVLASDEQWESLTGNITDIEWVREKAYFSFSDYTQADAFIILDSTHQLDYSQTTKPVFINSVTNTLKELNTPINVLRINGWNSFLNRPSWEIAGILNPAANIVLEKLNKKPITAADEPGLVAAKIIAMIINEAYFALGDGVSDKPAIDTAMKLGTNYPYGPFEWAEKIGLNNIYTLLQKLSLTDTRYQPAPMLVTATDENK
jgi:3-hydroxybutyryl-CoA dehydrogenase